MDTNSTRWRMLLAPWREAAKSLGALCRSPTKRDELSRDGIASGGIVWLRWDIADLTDDDAFDRDGAALLRQLELIELLDLIARVDRVVFEELVVTVCGFHEGVQLLHYTRSSEDDAVINFRFAYDMEVLNPAMLTTSLVIQRILVGCNVVETSVAFREVKKALLIAVEDMTRKPFESDRHRISVRLDCAGRSQCDASWLFALGQLAALQQSMEPIDAVTGDNSTHQYPAQLSTTSVLRICAVMITLVEEPEPMAIVLTSLARIAQSGIEISFLKISTVYFSTVDPVTVTLCLHELFAPSQNPALRQQTNDANAVVRGVRHLQLNAFMEYWVFRRICSAVAHSTSLRSLTLFEDESVTLDDFVENQRTAELLASRIRWLGFTLFSPFATHAVETLRFRADSFLVLWSHAIPLVVTNPHPINYLDMAFDNSIENTHIAVPRRTEVWLRKPHGVSASIDTDYVRFPQGLERIYVLGRDSDLQIEWLTIFYRDGGRRGSMLRRLRGVRPYRCPLLMTRV